MRRTRSGLLKFELVSVFLTLASCVLVSCSSRQESHPLSAIKGAAETRNDSNVLSGNSDAFGLLSAVPFRTYLNSFISDVRGPSGSSYRYSLMDGERDDCGGWSEFRNISEPMKIAWGPDGDKTLCLQSSEKDKTATITKKYRLKKSSAPEGGPTYALLSAPPSLTYRAQANIFVDGPEVAQYRASWKPGTGCGTLESSPWQNVDQPIELAMRYDGEWVLCLDVRDKFGFKNKTTYTHRWIRDSRKPVMDPLELPAGVLFEDSLEVQVTGSGVEYYSSVLMEGETNCASANYPAYTPASQPLKLNFPSDGKYTLCVLAGKGLPDSEDFLVQQAPFIHVLEKLSLQSKVEIKPVRVRRNTNGSLSFLDQTRSFAVSGRNLTHYKYLTVNSYLNDCGQQTPPNGEPSPVANPLNWTLSGATSAQDIRTICVWGMIINDSGTWIQEKPTHVSFYNDTLGSTNVSTSSLMPYPLSDAIRICAVCHSLYTENDFRAKGLPNVSHQVRTGRMPTGGWKSEEQKIRMLKFLYNISGYPQDLPLEVVAP